MRMRHYFAKNLLKEDAQSEYHSLLERFITKTSNGAISDQAFRSRLFAYKELEQKLDADADLKEFERRKAKQTAIRRYRETIYGPTKMAQSIIGLVVNFRRGSNSTSDNRLTADANLTYTSGQGLDITELTRERFADESELKRLQAAGMLPQQRLDDGLLKLEAAQTQLRM
jgi:hypothetical protein